MTARNIAAFAEPISPEAPCGVNLEDSGELSQLDAYQLFGQTSLDPVVRSKDDPVPKETRKSKSDRPPNWVEIADLSAGMLGKSHDLRILVHLSAAVLWTEGPQSFGATLAVAAAWIKDYWTQVFPLIDEDAIFRRNALGCLSDRVAILEGIRRAPLVVSRQHGRVCLRDIELASGAQHVEGDAPPDEARITAAFAEMPIADLKALVSGVGASLESLSSIDETTRSSAGVEAAPDFEPLVTQLKQLEAALRTRVALHPDGEPDAAADGGSVGGPMTVGAIRSREDAIRALEAAAEFFRRNEPSSPIPIIVERAKRLVAKDFLEVIADVAPEALASARAVGGIRD
jgi:type VI secretion system protein ImpA